jgi:CRISPR-associated protein Csx10
MGIAKTYVSGRGNRQCVFRVDKSPDDPTLLSWLESLGAQGVGQHTDERLGEILICHPFHKEVMPV